MWKISEPKLLVMLKHDFFMFFVKFDCHQLNVKWDILCPMLCAGGYPAPGVNHVVIRERQREDGGDVALGMLAGAATGLALGSLFSVF